VPEFIVHFETLGCRLNQIESESAARFFADAGFVVDMESMTAAAPVPENVVLSIINTCTVTGKAEQKARRLIRLLLRKMPHSCVLVTGCYAELEVEAIQAIDQRVCVLPGSRKDLLADIPLELKAHLDSVSGVAQIEITPFLKKLVDRLCAEKPKPTNIKNRHSEDDVHGHVSGEQGEGSKNEKKSLLVLAKPLKNKDLSGFTPMVASKEPSSSPVFRLATDTFFAHSRSSIKIQDGCNCECTYCRIHLARGRAVSLDVAEAVGRVQQLEEAGQQEVVLTGVNLSQYRGLYQGHNGKEYLNLAGLLQKILENTRSIRIRISSLYPESVDEDLCDVISHQRIQPYFHLSVQSGSDAILKAMRRPYRSTQVYRAVELLRQAKVNPFIACDIIAGFPGETDEDFALTQAMCQTCNFAWIHAFPFSPRPGTPAATMKGQVTQSVVGQRVKWLTSFAIQSKCSYISMWKGQVVSAITEHNRQDRKNSFHLDHGQEGHKEGGMEMEPHNGNQQCTHAVTENFIHLELPGAFPQGVSIRVRIGEPLLERIRAGDECEASGEAVEDGVQEQKMESTP
jgi:threonylcarbamoyladenosine tRNA methylthiotransferase MtaB